jgi:catechol 2,3-dioxygenase-like lactoylglutathione lyase family enzyme
MIEGLSHITLVVSDLERSATMLRRVFDAKELYASGPKQFSISAEMFFDVGGVWLVLMQGESLPSPSYRHIAFKIAEGDFEPYLKRIEALGLKVKPPRARVEGEGRSIYFYDYDNHLFELHTGTLQERLRHYLEKE